MQTYDIKEWQARLKICRRQAEIMIARGELPPPIRIGKLRRWTDAQIDRWICERASAVEVASSPSPSHGRGRPRRRG